MKHFFTFLLLLAFTTSYSQYTVKGFVYNEAGEPLDFASVFLKDSDFATATGINGGFEMKDVNEGTYIIKASFIGYNSVEQKIIVNSDLDLKLTVTGSIYNLDEIEIKATQAKIENPVPFTEMDREEINDANLGQDVPYILRWMPSVTVTSDAGAGIGYTGIRVRGSEASRTNVTINGVPLNDSESQSVFWVDLPDFLSNTQSIQVQRGVGVSTNGTSAFGATVHLNTASIRQNSFANLYAGGGSFGTTKLSAHAGTGIVNNKYFAELRYSRITSNGYVDRASSNLNSYFISAGRLSEGSSLRLNVFSGGERTYQAWNGLPYQFLETDRTYNISGTDYFAKEGEPYDNEIDNYRQTHGQLVYNKSVGEKSALNLTAHVTRGLGYFENYKVDASNAEFNITPDSISQDIVIQRWLDNVLFGLVGSYNYSNSFLDLTLGGGANQYNGDHFGDVIWRETDLNDRVGARRYYFNDAIKREGNIYARSTFNIYNVVFPFVDLQYRAVSYAGDGFNDERKEIAFEDQLSFFNPKFGLSIIPNKNHKVFAYYGIANREPSRDEYVNNLLGQNPKHETLYDLELGYELNSKYVQSNITLYNMIYNDQLIPTGELGNTGDAVRVNVDDSFRRGVELGLTIAPISRIQLGYNMTLSQNKIAEFTEYVDDWDTGGQIVIQHENTDIAYSPNQLHTIMGMFQLTKPNAKHQVTMQANYKIVGEQYLDNTSSEFSKLDAFSYLDLLFNYDTKFWKAKDFSLNLQVNNLLNNKYVSNGWLYRFNSDGYNPLNDDPYSRSEGNGFYNLTGLFPQATTNFLIGIQAKF